MKMNDMTSKEILTSMTILGKGKMNHTTRRDSIKSVSNNSIEIELVQGSIKPTKNIDIVHHIVSSLR